MKKSLIIAVVMLAAIILMWSFGLNFSSTKAIEIPQSLVGTELYVCPAADSTWDSISRALAPLVRYINVGFFFVIILLLGLWAWALYQSLLKDKVERKTFQTPWDFTKLTFWAAIIVWILVVTPNYFRTVHIQNYPGSYVLCENNTPGARAVKASALKL